MSLRVTYELDGCHGTVTRAERTSWPSLLALGGGVSLVAFALGGVLWFDTWVPVLGVAFVVLALFGERRSEGGVEQGPPIDPSWLFATRRVERRFAVRDGILELDAADGLRTCSLRGAEVRGTESGVLVVPELGDTIHLIWDLADSEEIGTLRDALQSATDDPSRRGGDADVPEALRALGRDTDPST